MSGMTFVSLSVNSTTWINLAKLLPIGKLILSRRHFNNLRKSKMCAESCNHRLITEFYILFTYKHLYQ